MRFVTPDGKVLTKDDLDDAMRTEAEGLVGRIAIEIWRLARRLERVPDGVRNELRPVADSATRLSDALAQYEVRLEMHDGQVYDDGLNVEVLSGLEPNVPLTVAETVEPTVVWKGRVVRRGKVILGKVES